MKLAKTAKKVARHLLDRRIKVVFAESCTAGLVSAALATILFRGGGGPANVEIALGPVLGYTLAHFTFFFLFGVLLSGLTQQVAKFPPLAFGVLILFVVFEVFFIAMVAVLGRWILEELAWWSVLLGNVLAAFAMGGYMWRVYPELAERLTSDSVWSD